MQQIENNIYKRTTPVYDVGFNSKITGHNIEIISQKITHGLLSRLLNYAQDSIERAGFKPFTDTCKKVEIYTTDADLTPSDRAYNVSFICEKGGYIELVGIFTKNGWPYLDHGFVIGQ